MERETEVKQIYLEFSDIKRVLDERGIRWWCASKSKTYNRIHNKGGVLIVSEATGISRSRIYRGLEEMEEELGDHRIRKEGGGRKKNNGETT